MGCAAHARRRRVGWVERKSAFTRVNNALCRNPSHYGRVRHDGGFRLRSTHPTIANDCRGERNMIRVPPIALAATMLWATPAIAQDYPNRPIRIIVQTQPGGLIDQIVPHLRAEAQREHRRASSWSRTAPAAAARSPPSTWPIRRPTATRSMSASHGTQCDPAAPTKLPYDPAKDFAPVIFLATTPTMLVVHPSVPAKSLKELVAYTKANPGKLTYALAGQRQLRPRRRRAVQAARRLDIVHVHYQRRGAGGAGSGRRPCLDDVRHRRVLAGAARRRKGARARGRRRRARRRCPTCRRWRKRACPRCRAARGSVWSRRPARRARSSTGSTARRPRRSPPGRAGSLRRAGLDAAARHAGGVRRAHRRRRSKRWGEVIRRGNISLK